MHPCNAKTQKDTLCKNKVADGILHCKKHLNEKAVPPPKKPSKGTAKPKSKGTAKPKSKESPKSKGTAKPKSKESPKSKGSKSLDKTVADPVDPNSSWPLYSTFWEYYELLEIIGQGTVGALFKIKSKMDGCFYTLKVLFKHNIYDTKETDALIALSHAPKCRNGVVCYHKKLRVPSKDIKEALPEKLGGVGEHAYVILMQYINGPSLHKLELEIDVIYDLLKSALETLVLIHGRNVIHRDIKPANLMIQNYLTSEGKKQRIVYIDFGFSVKFNPDKVISEWSGTPNFMCPEFFEPSARSLSFYKSADVFALGVTFYVVIAKRSPTWIIKETKGYSFDRKKFAKSINKILGHPSKQETVLFGVLKEMLSLENRPTAIQALAKL